MRRGTAFFAIALFLCLGAKVDAQSASVPTFDLSNPRASFTAMAEYLSADGGQWRSPNPNHDATQPRSAPAFGLWFDWARDRRVLELRIVVHYADSTVSSSKGQWVWHPAEDQLKYLMIGRNGSVTEGVTEFSDPSTFTTVATFFRPNGQTSVHRDDNVLVDGSLHRNETFQQNESGSWESQGVYEWRRGSPL